MANVTEMNRLQEEMSFLMSRMTRIVDEAHRNGILKGNRRRIKRKKKISALTSASKRQCRLAC